MSIPKDLYGTNRNVPEVDDRGWGATVTGILSDSIDGLDGVSLLQASGVVLLLLEPTDTALAGGATLTPTHPIHRVSGSGGAAVLDGTTAIADGTTNQLLILIGTDNTNTVEVPAAANTSLNGPVVLTSGDVIVLWWDVTLSAWRELARSN